MFRSHEDLINAVLSASEDARRGLEKWPDYKVFEKNQDAMLYNEQVAAQLLHRQDRGSVGWLNDAVLFLFHEFICEEHGPGERKALALDRCRQDAAARYGRQREIVQLVEQSFLPFVDLYNELQVWRARHKGKAVACLLLAALPLEFRAIMRRLDGLSGVQAFPNPKRARMHEVQSLLGGHSRAGVSARRAFMHAFDRVLDGKVPRNFWLLAEGVVGCGSSEVKVGVLLLPQYGGHEAQSFVKLAEDELSGYQEILVTGVAGRLHDDLAIGDVVVSRKIYDGTLAKRVPNSRGGEIFVNEDDPWEWDFLEHGRIIPDAEEIRVALKEELPKGRSGSVGGFSRIIATDVVSASTLSKSKEYKRRLNERFPSCGALEMEALGCCAAYRGEVVVRVIKGLCDKADFTKSKEWQPYCADAAAAVAIRYVQINYGQQGLGVLSFPEKKDQIGGRRVSSSNFPRATSG